MRAALVGGARGCYGSVVLGRFGWRFGWRLGWNAMLVVALALAGCEPEAPRMRAVHADRAEADPPPPVADRADPPAPVADQADPPPASAPSIEPDDEPLAPAPSLEGWNEAQIRWETYEAGLARAQRESRPVLLVMSATWCGHCRTYSHVFEDARVVERSRRFVMVHIDSDVQRDVAERYVVDGRYVPRTYFLAPDGAPMAVTATNPRFRYFYDEHDAASLVAGMDAAIAQAGG